MNIISRAQWGARHAAGFGSRPIGNLERWAHHSVTATLPVDASLEHEAAQMRAIEQIGQSRFGGGFSYTFAIFPSGRVYEGTGVSRRGSHTDGRNTRAVGIVFVGNYEAATPSAQMLQGAADLLRHGVEHGWWKSATWTGGHRDLKPTACPGRNVYSQLRAIEGLAAVGGGGYSAPAGPSAPEPAAPQPARNADGSLRLAEDGSRGPATISRWQEVLGTPIDGSISSPSALIGADQRMLNALVGGDHIRNLIGARRLLDDGYEGPKTIKVRQFLLFNHHAEAVLGRGAQLGDFDGVAGPTTTRLHQRALNLATARSGRY